MAKPELIVIRCQPDTKKAFRRYVVESNSRDSEDALRRLLGLDEIYIPVADYVPTKEKKSGKKIVSDWFLRVPEKKV